jgi:hypothetical protein
MTRPTIADSPTCIGCRKPIKQNKTGRPRVWCSDACKNRGIRRPPHPVDPGFDFTRPDSHLSDEEWLAERVRINAERIREREAAE